MLAPLIAESYQHTAAASEANRVTAWNILASVAFDTAIACGCAGMARWHGPRLRQSNRRPSTPAKPPDTRQRRCA